MATNLKQHLSGKPNLMEAGGENREKKKGSSDSIEAMQCDRRLRIIWSLSISGCHEAECFPDEKLKTECKRDKGKEWPKIANIRRVETYGSDSVEE
ncbi:hypothetical protein CISIN_1g044307mg, partial [Citrus sinensis]